MKIIPVILSGGIGKRLWPLSRQGHPKQYLKLLNDKTMLQETILRLKGLSNLGDPIIVCNNDHRFLVAEQCQQIDVTNPKIMLESTGRNTAPAIAAAALKTINELDDAVLLVLPADHTVEDVESFHSAITLATQQAEKGKMAIFGIVPTSANTGYGYIKSSKGSFDCVSKVEKFIEKPNLQTAQLFYKQGKHLWNSGMFMFKAKTIIKELIDHAPDIVDLVKSAVENAIIDMDFIRLEEKAFESSPSCSIDYAIMEKSDNVVVVPLDAKWNDIGSWSALYDIGEKDNNGNVIQGDVFTKKTINTYISATHHMIATIGVNDLVIVDTPNATLVATKNKSNEVNKIVAELKHQGREEHACHNKVYRPWGWYDSIEKKKNFQIKRIYVKPGSKLSLQSHKHRAEHWIIIKGKAIVTKGDDIFSLEVNQSTFIPIGEKHSLENYSKFDSLEIVEVQSGAYFGEDDIIRYEDIYNRHLID